MKQNKTPFQLFIEQVEKLEAKTGKQGAFNLVGKTTTAILKLAKEFQKLEENFKPDCYSPKDFEKK